MSDPSRRRLLRLAALLPLGACGNALEKPYPDKRTYVLEAIRPDRRPPNPRGPVLLLRRVQAAPGYEGRGLIFRTGSEQRIDFYQEFALPPAQAIAATAADWFTASGRFSAVIPAHSQLEPRYALEGELNGLYARLDPPAPRLVIDLSLRLLDLRGAVPTIAARHDLRGPRPLADASGDAYARAAGQAVAEALTGLETALSRL